MSTIIEDVIIKAIKSKRLLAFHYQGKPRIVEPHVFGVMGELKQLLVYQVRGHSSSGQLPAWRRLMLSEITQITLLDESFPGARETPTGKHSLWTLTIALVE